MSVLVIDVGTSGVRAAVVDADGSVRFDVRRPNPPDTPFPGLVEFDAAAMATLAIELATDAIERAGDVGAVGITNQRASTIVWDRATGTPVAPALGWQDLRTAGDCLTWQADGLRLSPNATASKAAHLVAGADRPAAELCIGTVDSWLIWHLTGGGVHVTDASNAGVTELIQGDDAAWDDAIVTRLGLSVESLPTIVDSVGVIGEATALPGAPPIAGIAGDQQASLVGQSCVRAGQAKITFGTGGMLDVCVGPQRPPFPRRSDHGIFPIVAWRDAGELTWGTEAIMLAAGANVEWLCDDLGILPDPAASHEVAASVESTDGVIYVPAPLGLGSPHWDFGARGTLLGLTRGSSAAHITRAVLEGVAQRGADLVEATEADTGLTLERLRIDGGMSANPTFAQAVADACGRPVELAAEPESTTVGAAYLAGLATGVWSGWDDIADAWAPREVIEPQASTDRSRWHEAVEKSRRWHPELSELDF